MLDSMLAPARCAVPAFLFLFCAVQLCAQTVRIGVLGITHPNQLTLSCTASNSLVVLADGRTLYLEPRTKTETIQIRASQNAMYVNIADQEFHVETLHAFGRDSQAAPFVLNVPGKIERRYFGSLEIKMKAGELEPIVTMDRELAVASIVQAEAIPQSPIEALKAQAVVTRSYLAAGTHRHRDFDFCDLTHCQVLRESPDPQSRVMLAVIATRNLVIIYEGKIVAAMFTRSCAGHTATLEQIGITSREYPYFSVFCKICHEHPVRWTYTVSPNHAGILSAHTESARLAIDRCLGWNAIRSNTFTEDNKKTATNIGGIGQGHGVGLCQRGAVEMAREHATFNEIIGHYFPNTQLAPTSAPLASK
jgi:peptidoglycan hydrolase-like amidase